ncbi:MAG: DUF3135 domain-containing protein [Gammaproteobacteria bacterium]
MSNSQDNNTAQPNINSLDKLGIEAWIKLNQENPELFNQLSRELLESTLKNTAPQNEMRLRGLQFQIDSQKKLAKNPMQACIKISEMMWEKVGELCTAIESLDSLIKNTHKPETHSKQVSSKSRPGFKKISDKQAQNKGTVICMQSFKSLLSPEPV